MANHVIQIVRCRTVSNVYGSIVRLARQILNLKCRKLASGYYVCCGYHGNDCYLQLDVVEDGAVSNAMLDRITHSCREAQFIGETTPVVHFDILQLLPSTCMYFFANFARHGKKCQTS